jgi:hypothetical protein
MYRKNKNTELFKDLTQVVEVAAPQNYIPLYSRFLELNSTNWNNVNLAHPEFLVSVNEKHGSYFTGVVSNEQTDRKVDLFFKMSPLLDPCKYLTGNYQAYDFTLPTMEPHAFPKMSDVNNAAFTDGFFCYLTGQVLQDHGFKHGIRFYGSYLGIKQNYVYNVEEDLDSLLSSDFFSNNMGVLFKLNKDIPIPVSSSKYKHHLSIEDAPDLDLDVCELGCEDVSESPHTEPEVLDDLEKNSTCSSNSSNTNEESEDDQDLDEDDGEEICAIIDRFPVQVIALENLENTLDSLMSTIKPNELTSALLQVIMTLIAYQKMFKFTHNDLHSNNVMFVETTDEFVCYCYENTCYRVPTYGRLFKIIDFGRAIYTYADKRFVSDSFSLEGDAATQYNLEPYLNPAKPPLEPNYSFDLCRLACSLMDVLPDTDDFDELNSLFEEWCEDDKRRNVLYKQNGVERYPNFKLYKMIARTVHNHTPEAQLKRRLFNQFVVKKKKCSDVMNLDLLPRI